MIISSMIQLAFLSPIESYTLITWQIYTHDVNTRNDCTAINLLGALGAFDDGVNARDRKAVGVGVGQGEVKGHRYIANLGETT